MYTTYTLACRILLFIMKKSDPAVTLESPGRRVRKRAQMLDQIAAAAARLFDESGYEAVTMEQIAIEADVSKRTLYKHFAVKGAVLAHVLDAELARDLANCEFKLDRNAGFTEAVGALLAQSAAWCSAHPDYLLPYIRHKLLSFDPNAAIPREGDMVQTWALFIAHGQSIGELDSTKPAAQLAFYFHYLYFSALMRWLANRALSLEQEFATIVTLFVEGVASRKPATRRR